MCAKIPIYIGDSFNTNMIIQIEFLTKYVIFNFEVDPLSMIRSR